MPAPVVVAHRSASCPWVCEIFSDQESEPVGSQLTVIHPLNTRESLLGVFLTYISIMTNNNVELFIGNLYILLEKRPFKSFLFFFIVYLCLLSCKEVLKGSRKKLLTDSGFVNIFPSVVVVFSIFFVVSFAYRNFQNLIKFNWSIFSLLLVQGLYLKPLPNIFF